MKTDDWRVQLPEGMSGDWKVERFDVSESDASLQRMRAFSTGGRFVSAGSYTGLWNRRTLVMSDTSDEMRDHSWAISEAKTRGGDVLVNGLGLGMVVSAMLMSHSVKRITVIEKSEDVIKLVGPTLEQRHGAMIEIVNDDAFDYRPEKGKRFTVVWHDIWTDLCSDNLGEMATLHRRYGRRCDWQGSWGKEWINAHR